MKIQDIINHVIYIDNKEDHAKISDLLAKYKKGSIPEYIGPHRYNPKDYTYSSSSSLTEQGISYRGLPVVKAEDLISAEETKNYFLI